MTERAWRWGMLLIFAVSLGLAAGPWTGPRADEKALSPKYRDWLDLAAYIIRPEERSVFLELASDRDRDLFIEAFWKQRDPTPGTPQNEYREEHLKRFFNANDVYGRGTSRPGWMTDMGRISIILGPPAGVERFDVSGVYPCQVWSYYGDARKGLPAHFTLLFFQRSGAGEYKLYNSLSDGPLSLLIDKKGLDSDDHARIYSRLRELAPTLAGPAVSMIPGQTTADFRPSLRDNLLLSDIIQSPTKSVSPRYATHFLNYRGQVSTEYLTNYVESRTSLAVLRDPVLGIPFVHFSISPASLSIDAYEPKSQYFCSFQIHVTVRRGDILIYQYSKDLPFYFPAADLDLVRGSGVAVLDAFPTIEGDSVLSVLLMNSVGKEFSVLEQSLKVPPAPTSPGISGPVLGYRLEESPGDALLPFKILDRRVFIDPQNTLSRSEDVSFLLSVASVSKDLWENGALQVRIQRLGQAAPGKILRLPLNSFPFRADMAIHGAVPARDLVPDYYEADFVLMAGDSSILDEKKVPFVVSPQDTVPHPTTLVRPIPSSARHLHHLSLAYQSDKAGMPEKAEASYRAAQVLNPDYAPGIVEYARFLLKAGRFGEALDLVERLKDRRDLRFQYLFLKGNGLMGQGDVTGAVDQFTEANRIYDSDTSLLNALGVCYSRLGEKGKALDALRASLRLNPDQPEVRKAVAELERK